jgi:HSP20 family protein
MVFKSSAGGNHMTNWIFHPTRTNPHQLMTEIHDRMFYTNDVSPRANVLKTKAGYTLEVELPGFSRSDIDIQTQNGVLAITAKRETSDVKQDLVSREFNTSNLTRSWSLPKNVNVETIDASYDAGILTVTLPFKTTVDTAIRRIEIR